MSVNSKLAELRRLRKEGKTQRDINFDEDRERIYDELDEREFEQHQRERLKEDDFVIDDDGKGYVDTGAYEWDQTHYGSSDEEEQKRTSSAKRRHKQESGGGPRDGDITAIFRTQKRVKPSSAAPAPKASNKSSSPVDIDAIMSEVGSAKRTPGSANSSFGLGSTLGSNRRSGLGSLGSSVGSSLGFGLGSGLGSGIGLGSQRGARSKPSETPTRNLPGSRLSSDDNDLGSEPSEGDVSMIGNSITNVVHKPQEELSLNPVKLEAQAAPLSTDPLPLASDPPEMPSSEAEPVVAEHSLLTPGQSSDDNGDELDSFNSSAWNLVSDETEAVETNINSAVEQGQLFRFFWLDYSESTDNGNLSLFGKTESGKSVTVIVRNTYRNIMALPREGRTCDDVKAELDSYFKRVAKANLPFKTVELRDCFSEGKPKRTYVNARAPFVKMHIPLEGKSYSQLTGTTSTAIENFMVSRQIMGPCWLDVKVKANARAAGWTQVGVEVDRPFHITPVPENEQAKLGVPKFTVMSLFMTTVPDAKLHHEVVSISARVFRNVDETNHDATALPSTLHTGIRPPQHGFFPPGFKEEVAKHNKLRTAKGQSTSQVVSLHDSERGLIAWFLALLRRTDPDAIVGHSLTDVHLATIFSRALHHKDKMVSSLGRIRDLPHIAKPSSYAQARYFSGRLILDLKNSFGMDLVSGSCREYTLDEMTRTILGQKRKFLDTNITSGTFLQDGAAGLMEVIRRSEYDTLYISSIAMKIQMLALSRQLSNLSGSPWRTTLSGHRSERNDYLLMHEFTKDNDLVPDRPQGRGPGDNGSYTGGLVFNPVVGLHQSCVLVMDFNSLYPSIMQEYNICFTTVECSPNSTEEPQEPDANVKMGLLPKLLRAMVERRRAVKGLMKDPKATPAQLAEWDIRQTALKLTANAVYGCLGQSSSRFAARPLAKLVTQKGREALDQTRKLADENNMRVLYGDTDSVMIHTSATNYANAVAIGKQFKSVVNSQYKYMEIDIDHVFRQLFLYKKKKYAAVVMNPQGDLKLEFKGLDVVRREFSDVCKISFTQSLNLLFGLSGKKDKNSEELADPLESFEKIYTYLAEYSEYVRSGQETPKKFIIRQQLSKDLDQYQKLDMPQLLVAKAKIDAGGTVKAKDVIGFIISQLIDDEDKRSETQRAVSYETLVKENLAPDYEYYLSQQVYKPIKRILEVIEGFDSLRLADVMSVPGEKPAKVSSGSGNEYDGFTGEAKFVTIGDPKRRFEKCDRLTLTYGGHSFEFSGLDSLQPQGICVPNSQGLVLPYEEVIKQVDGAIRHFVNIFYQDWLLCDDCKCYTRSISTFGGRKCPRPDCVGTSMEPLYTARDLNNQVMYFKSLFDSSSLDDGVMNNVAVYSPKNQLGLQQVTSICDKFLQRSAFTRINIGQYFVA